MGRSNRTYVHSGDVEELIDEDEPKHACLVELRDHVGMHLRTKEPIDLNQWIIVVTIGNYFGPKQVGYLAKSMGAKLATISEWNKIPRADRTYVLDQLSTLAGWPVEALEYPI